MVAASGDTQGIYAFIVRGCESGAQFASRKS